MLIYIVQFISSDYECTCSENIKAFFKLENAELFKTELEVRNLELKERLDRLGNQLDREEQRIRTLKVGKEEKRRLVRESRMNYMEVRKKIIDDADDEYILNDYSEFHIESIETGDFPDFFKSDDFIF